jgi:hypothetical protein
MSSSFTNAYFGGLSISSLASDDYSDNNDDDKSVQSQLQLYRRLQDLEEITDHLLSDKNIVLSMDHDTFAEVEINVVTNLDLLVPIFDHAQHVLQLRVESLPDCNDQHILRSIQGLPAKANLYQPLDIVLRKNELHSHDHVEEDLEFRPHAFGDAYTFALTYAHRFTAGRYTLRVQMQAEESGSIQKHYQPIRVSYRICQQTRAAPIDVGSKLHGTVGLNEYKYYR